MAQILFGVADYVVFIISLLVSAAIGVYFAFCGNNKTSEDEYLYGSKKMKAVPVGLSLYSSAISAVSIIGIPAEVYVYGTGYITGVFGIILGMFIVWIVFLPVFCGNLNIKTPYEYFERRFGTNVKILSSVIYIIHTLLMMPIVLYAPSLAVAQATNVNVLICTSIIGGICIFYTTFGGFKTVIWTDSLQATLMLFSCLLVAITGVNKAGGFSQMWDIALQNGRINSFNMDPNPFIRITFWTVTIGLAFIHASHSGCSAGALQRYMSLPSENQAKISTIVGIIGTSLIHIIGGVTGLAMFAIYSNCDPIKNHEINGSKRLVPHFVTQTLEYAPGFPGFFIAGLLSAALSSLSSELNVVSGIIYYDFLKKFRQSKFGKVTESRGTFTMKTIVIINGLIYLLCVPLLQKTDHIYELTLSVGSITYGAKLGMLFLGILFPKTNSKGVISGAIASMLIIGWIDFSANYYKVSSHYALPTSIEHCAEKANGNLSTSTMSTIATTFISTSTANILKKHEFELPASLKNCTQIENRTLSGFNTSTNNIFYVCNNTESILKKPELQDIFLLYRMSHLYYCLFGTIITIVVGNIVSYLTKPNKLTDVDPLLVAPFLRSYIKKQHKVETEMYQKEQQ